MPQLVCVCVYVCIVRVCLRTSSAIKVQVCRVMQLLFRHLILVLYFSRHRVVSHCKCVQYIQ